MVCFRVNFTFYSTKRYATIQVGNAFIALHTEAMQTQTLYCWLKTALNYTTKSTLDCVFRHGKKIQTLLLNQICIC